MCPGLEVETAALLGVRSEWLAGAAIPPGTGSEYFSGAGQEKLTEASGPAGPNPGLPWKLLFISFSLKYNRITT